MYTKYYKYMIVWYEYKILWDSGIVSYPIQLHTIYGTYLHINTYDTTSNKQQAKATPSVHRYIFALHNIVIEAFPPPHTHSIA